MSSSPHPGRPRVVILSGPTATGKTALALELAARNPRVEIVNGDSLLVYRGLDVGTAKPTADERARAPHHLIDRCEPDEPFTAGDFERAAREAIAGIEARGRRAIVVGGSGFYLKALLYGLWDTPKADPALRAELESRTTAALHAELTHVDPAAARRIGANDRYRLVRALEMWRLSGRTPTELAAAAPKTPDPALALWVIDRDPAELEARIATRARSMIDGGLIEETRRALERFGDVRPLGAVGYAETVRHLRGEKPPGRQIPPGIPGLIDEITLATRQLVKRQRTWFRGERSARWFRLDADRDRLLTELEEIYAED